MTSITPEEVWEAHVSDPDFLQIPEEVRNTLRPHIEALPELLGEYVNQPLTLRSFMYSKALFVRHCIEHGFAERAKAEWPDELIDEFQNMNGMVNSLEEFLEWNLLAFGLVTHVEDEDIAEDNNALLASLSSESEVHEEVRKRCIAGTLTVGDMLKFEPLSLSTFTPLDGLDE